MGYLFEAFTHIVYAITHEIQDVSNAQRAHLPLICGRERASEKQSLCVFVLAHVKTSIQHTNRW